MLPTLLTILLTVTCYEGEELTHFCEAGESPQCTKDHLPIGSCWSCQQEDGTETVCVENCVYECLNPCCLRGVWMPEAPILFRPLKADPRQLTASAGWRFNDRALDLDDNKHVIDVSYWDYVPIYRWFNIGMPCGELELDLEGALWGVFHPMAPKHPLVNTDYYIGLTLDYAHPLWDGAAMSYRFRFYHISCHVGDEFLLAHPDFDRKNPSSEIVDLFASYTMWEDALRFYLGVGSFVHRDSSYPFKPFFSEWGAEVYMPWLNFFSVCHMLKGQPFAAGHFRLSEDHNWHIDQTYVLGYEFAKLYGLERCLRIFLEFHNGHSLEGQFSRHQTEYLSLRASYGF